MMFTKFMLQSVLGVCVFLSVEGVFAQAVFPERTIRIIIGYPPGSPSDIVARLISQKWTETLGKPVVVDNISGAAGNIGTERVARAAPDGYTLGLMIQGQIAINPSLYKLPYDPIKDFAPVSQVSVSPIVLVVGGGVPVKSVKELLALAKAQPGELTFASSGSGTDGHLTGELFKSMAGVDIRHIPYKGVVAALPDLIGGRVTTMFPPLAVALPMVREGKLRAIAVTPMKRSAALPDVPTVDESGVKGFEATSWNGLLAPSGTPVPVIRLLQQETAKALAQPDVRGKLADLAMEGIGNSPDEFGAVIRLTIQKWAKLIREAGIRPE